MKKKKGFTLIELLAVIVVLAIIALIAMPLIMNVIDEAKKGAAVSSGYEYIRTIELEAVNHMAQGGSMLNGTYTIKDADLYDESDKLVLDITIKGSKPVDGGTVIIVDNIVTGGTITINNHELAYNGKDFNVEITEVVELEFNEGDFVYFNPETGRECSREDAVSTPGTNAGCMKWYVLNKTNNSGKMDLILDHNVIGTLYSDEEILGILQTFENTNILEIVEDGLDRAVSTWNVEYRLPTGYDVISRIGFFSDVQNGQDISAEKYMAYMTQYQTRMNELNNDPNLSIGNYTNLTPEVIAQASEYLDATYSDILPPSYMWIDSFISAMSAGGDFETIMETGEIGFFTSTYFETVVSGDLEGIIPWVVISMDGPGTLIDVTKLSSEMPAMAMFELVGVTGIKPIISVDKSVFTNVDTNTNITSSYRLVDGPTFNSLIPSETTSIVFTDEKAPSGATVTDLSSEKDNSVVSWLDGTTYYVSSQKEGQKIVFNSNSSFMFRAINVDNYTIYFENLASIQFNDMIDTSQVTDMSNMFEGTINLTNLDLSSFNTSRVTNMYRMFLFAVGLTTLDLSNFDTRNVNNMSYMFFFDREIETLTLGKNFKTAKVTDMSHLFEGCTKLLSLNLSSFNTSRVVDMNNMFSGCESLTTLDLSHFDTYNVTNMSEMFDNCAALKTLDISNFNTYNVTNMSRMFTTCESLQSLNLSSFVTSNVTSMHAMFWGCASLTTLDLSNFNPANVTSLAYMFADCTSLTSLNLSNFSTPKATDIQSMFQGCENLKVLDISKLDLTNVGGKTAFVFDDMYRLEQITFGPNWKWPDYYNGGLPEPNPDYIPGAKGVWYTASGKSYTVSTIPEGAGTYYAVKP